MYRPIDTTRTLYEAIEECLAQNHMVGLFEIDSQHVKVYISKSLNSARVFVKTEDSVKSSEPTFPIYHRETTEATLCKVYRFFRFTVNLGYYQAVRVQ